MKNYIFVIILLFNTVVLSQTIPTKEWQIKTALMAVPEEYKDGAKIYGYDAQGSFVTLKEGSNEYIALASDPKKKNFSTAAYHKSLDEFMARGRELKAQGKEFQEIFDIREAEVKSGKLKMPNKTSLSVFTGKVNKVTKEIENGYLRHVPACQLLPLNLAIHG